MTRKNIFTGLEEFKLKLSKQAELPPAPPEADEPPAPAEAAVPKVDNQPVAPEETKMVDKSGQTEEGVQQTPFISQSMADFLNKQIGNEILASYTYYAAYGWFKNKGLDGFAKWVESQAKDEITHAMKIYEFMLDSGLTVVFPAIPAPKAAYSDAREIVETIFEHEKGVTADWRNIGKMAIEQQDTATQGLAEFFVAEQVEEENKVLHIQQRLKMDAGALCVLLVDNSLR